MNDNSLNYSIKNRAKTFYFASLFFSKEIKYDVEILYFFCRYIDDIGDSNISTKKESKKELKKIQNQLKTLKSNNIIVSNFINLLSKYNINVSVPIELINGVLSDLENVNIKNYEDLIDYSFKVAGTVGLMMCDIMKINDLKLRLKGVQLGIAMQLTNISRDIKEDLEQKRIYFPQTLRSKKNYHFSEILTNKLLQKEFSRNLETLLKIADEIYKISWNGIIKLPFRYKIPIAIASCLYQSIGSKIRKKNYDIWEKRIYLTSYEKFLKTIKTLYKLFFYKDTKIVINTERKIKKILKKFDSVYCD